MSTRRKTFAMASIGSAIMAAVLVTAFAVPASASTPRAQVIRHGPAHLLHRVSSTGSVAEVQSTNWAGYANKNHTFSLVQATWKQPTVSCTSTDAIASFWVGIDGFGSSTVEQAGTLAYCHDSKVTYYTWWEMSSSNGTQLVGSSVKPGDLITASVAVSGHSYTLKVVDKTAGANSFTKTSTCSSCKNASAEWIAERPAGQHGLYPLAKFGHVVFGDAKVGVGSDRGSISKYSHASFTMINSKGATMASVSALQDAGAQFTATWLRMQ